LDAKHTFFCPEAEESRPFPARAEEAPRPEAILTGLDDAGAEPDNRRWPRLPDEKPSESAVGIRQSGRWPLLLDESRILKETEKNRPVSGEFSATLRKVDRLQRLEREQAGEIWNARPF
jgi:hypothetical protein